MYCAILAFFFQGSSLLDRGLGLMPYMHQTEPDYTSAMAKTSLTVST